MNASWPPTERPEPINYQPVQHITTFSHRLERSVYDTLASAPEGSRTRSRDGHEQARMVVSRYAISNPEIDLYRHAFVGYGAW